METKPKALIDTNVLLRLTQYAPQKTSGSEAGQAEIRSLVFGAYDPHICFQNLTEYWTVASRPVNVNGLGLSTETIVQRIKWIRSSFKVVPESIATINTWIEICREHQVTGKRAHDARLAATAIAYDIKPLITFNPSDFQAFTKLTIISPAPPASSSVNIIT